MISTRRKQGAASLIHELKVLSFVMLVRGSCSLLSGLFRTQRWHPTRNCCPIIALQGTSDRDLLSGVLKRAERTLTKRIISSDGQEDTTIHNEIRDTLKAVGEDILQNDINSADFARTRDQTPSDLSQLHSTLSDFDVNIGYGQNPTITSTALAHMLWRSVLRPGIDSAIDATAGNGGDSVALATMLFPTENMERSSHDTASELVCVDIQKEACSNTTKELQAVVSPHVLESNIQVVHASHSPLPLPRRKPCSVALVVYNLGYLPTSSKEFLTQTDSTLVSMTDAVLYLRVGGMLSVMTYPRSNPEEDWAVHVFLEGLALFTSNTHDWREFVSTSKAPATVHEKESRIRELILQALERVWQRGPSKQTWRVHEHRKLGWMDAPILLYAVRIK